VWMQPRERGWRWGSHKSAGWGGARIPEGPAGPSGPGAPGRPSGAKAARALLAGVQPARPGISARAAGPVVRSPSALTSAEGATGPDEQCGGHGRQTGRWPSALRPRVVSARVPDCEGRGRRRSHAPWVAGAGPWRACVPPPEASPPPHGDGLNFLAGFRKLPKSVGLSSVLSSFSESTNRAEPRLCLAERPQRSLATLKSRVR
jgi:hypothetical protein